MDVKYLKQNEELLRGIVRTIDKNLEYSLTDESQEQTFFSKLSARGRHATVSLSIEDLRLAGRRPGAQEHHSAEDQERP